MPPRRTLASSSRSSIRRFAVRSCRCRALRLLLSSLSSPSSLPPLAPLLPLPPPPSPRVPLRCAAVSGKKAGGVRLLELVLLLALVLLLERLRSPPPPPPPPSLPPPLPLPELLELSDRFTPPSHMSAGNRRVAAGVRPKLRATAGLE